VRVSARLARPTNVQFLIEVPGNLDNRMGFYQAIQDFPFAAESLSRQRPPQIFRTAADEPAPHIGEFG
jgi:hypothetical protein